MAELLKLENVSCRAGDRKILDGVSFTIREGEIFGLLGPNGAGKSTTMKIVAGLLEQSAGAIYMGEENLWLGSHVRRQIAMVPQEPAVLHDLTVRENLDYFASQIGAPEGKVAEAIMQLELDRYAERPAKFLSGGYRQLLNIAIGLLQSPRILFLDEPSVGLDPVTRSRLWDKVLEIRQKGTSICISTHYMEEAQALCDRVCLMNDGRVVALDTPENLIKAFAKAQLTIFTLKQEPETETIELLRKKIPDAEAGVSGTNVILRFSQKNPEAVEKARTIFLLADTEVLKIRNREADLEQVFINLTGKELKGN